MTGPGPGGPPPGPAWLGIGAQRSGTTWFTDLLCQHPQVALGTNDKKEQQALHLVADGELRPQAYLKRFPQDGPLRGEWTPAYMRHLSTVGACARLLRPEVPLLVLLRDPVVRYESAMRLRAGRDGGWPWPAAVATQTWAGFYADQLSAWSDRLGRDRMVVMVYEQVRDDPQSAVDAVWRRLGLDPVPLAHVERPSGSSSKAGWVFPEGLRETLQALYRRQADRLESDWGLDTSGWTVLRGADERDHSPAA